MSNRAQKAITCLFDPGSFGRYVCSEDFRVAGRSYRENGIKCQKAAETITLKSISAEKGQSFAARPIQWSYFLPCSFPRDFPRAPTKYHPAMSQLAAMGFCSGTLGRAVPPRNAPCQTRLIRRVLLNCVAPGQVWQGLRSYSSVWI